MAAIAVISLAACSSSARTSEPTQTPEHSDDVLVQEVNGIRIQASNFRIENRLVTLDLCYEIPDERSWLASHLEARTNTQAASTFELALTELRLPAIDGLQTVVTQTDERQEPDQNNGRGLRCDVLKIREILPESEAVELTIGALQADPSEGGVCDPDYLARVNALLDTYDTELEADCYMEFLDGGVGEGLRIVSRPDTMSELEAQAIMDDDFYLDLNGIRGPWVFTIPASIH